MQKMNTLGRFEYPGFAFRKLHQLFFFKKKTDTCIIYGRSITLEPQPAVDLWDEARGA